MTDHPNAELYRKAFGAFMSGEDPSGAGISDEIVWWQMGTPEPLRGKQAVLESMAGLPEGIQFNIDVHDVVANDDHVVALINANVKIGDQDFTYRTAEIHHVKDGEITERWAFSDDTEAIRKFFGQFAR